MSDELQNLRDRARRLEEENGLLRALQSPDGDETPLRAENALLRRELDLLTRRPRAADPAGASGGPSPASAVTDDEAAAAPASVEEFNAMAPPRRRDLAARMTPRQRDELLGRRPRARAGESYL